MQSLVDFGRNALRNVVLSHPKRVCNYKMQNICVQTNIRGLCTVLERLLKQGVQLIYNLDHIKIKTVFKGPVVAEYTDKII